MLESLIADIYASTSCSIVCYILFAQSDYDYNPLHTLIKKIVVFPEKAFEFTMLDESIIKITIPRYRLVDHYGRKKTSGS